MKKSIVYSRLSDSLTSAKKIRIIMDLIKDIDVNMAERVLEFHPSKGARILSKVLKSAIANAENNLKISRDSLYISEVFANEASMLKRGKPGSRGNSYPILKRRSHVVIGLSERTK
ncbi:MAG: 50S ribosomal protein L22 [Proteobacteria bacterium]|nr:50S ribosomal protein L22 [Pseudomonadota bacterium]